ncbi:MAG TPA: hypothetical protein VIN40_10030 [Candidatus Tyrphobacter sp.]
MINEHPNITVLIDYVHRELIAEEDAAVHTHLAACEPCKGAYEEQARITERLRAHAYAEERDLPYAVVARVRERVAGQARVAWWQHLNLVFRPVVGLPVAAAFVLAALLGYSSLKPHAGAPTIAAAYYLDAHSALTNMATPFAQPAAVPASLQDSGKSATQTTAMGPTTIASE